MNYILVFDGGSRGNPGRSYGSFRIQPSGEKPFPPQRRKFGFGTNNEAEYLALIAGLVALLEHFDQVGTEPKGVNLELRGDSRLVLRQLQGTWKAKNPRMRELRDKTLGILERFATFQITHQDRARTVEVLGH